MPELFNEEKNVKRNRTSTPSTPSTPIIGELEISDKDEDKDKDENRIAM